MRELRAVTPQDAKRVWESQRQPTPSTVARALSQAGQKVDAKTIARWKARNWMSASPQRHPLESAWDALETAIPLLTGDPTSTIWRVGRMEEMAELLEKLTEDELYRQRTRALRTVVVVVSLELARRVKEFIPERIDEYTLLLKAVTLAFRASFDADGSERKLT
jgi:hypothetical protein